MSVATMTGAVDDFVLPFQIEAQNLRGRLVRLGPLADDILHRHANPEPIGRTVAEALAVAAALSSTIKYDGIFTLQARGKGPLGTLVADVTSEGAMRAYAGYDRERLDREFGDEPLTMPPSAAMLGGGHLAFTVDGGEDFERYQGIVELAPDGLGASVLHYFQQSEQIVTGLRLAVDQVDGQWRASAILLQRLPRELGEAVRGEIPRLAPDEDQTEIEEGWRRAMVLLASATEQEMLDPALDAERLLYRLFHEDGVRVYPSRSLEFRCRCGPDRTRGILKSFPREEIEDMKVDGLVTVTCEFCHRSDVFTDADLDTLYADDG